MYHYVGFFPTTVMKISHFFTFLFFFFPFFFFTVGQTREPWEVLMVIFSGFFSLTSVRNISIQNERVMTIFISCTFEISTVRLESVQSPVTSYTTEQPAMSRGLEWSVVILKLTIEVGSMTEASFTENVHLYKNTDRKASGKSIRKLYVKRQV